MVKLVALIPELVMFRPFSLSLILCVGLARPAFAEEPASGDDDEIDFGEDEFGDAGDDEEAVERLKDGDDKAPEASDPNDDEWIDDIGNEEDEELEFDEEEFEEDSDVSTAGEGQDTARVYRDYLDQVSDLGADEEALAWERYVKKYPASVFRSRIDKRLEELSQEMYGQRIEGVELGRVRDAGTAELNFAQPMTLANIDPRSKLRGAFEWGVPGFLALTADYERQIKREFSVHGGLHGRYTGTNVEVGAKYALVKSARTKMLVTAMADLHLNMDPFHPGFKPQMGFGKRFELPGGAQLDTMLQTGVDALFMTASDGTGQTSLRYVGGGSITLKPTPTVQVYMETNMYMKGFGHEQIGSFRFNTVAFGIKFVNRKGAATDRYVSGIGATAPYTSNYWGYHFGSIMGDVNYYL
jgi:hypothetical protein